MKGRLPSESDLRPQTMKRLALSVAAWCSASGVVWAHPGHGVTDPETPAHYVVEPAHALPVLILIGAIALVAYRVRAGRRN